MTVAVRVSATVTGHRRRGAREHELVLALAPGEVTARQLIAAAVAAELTAFQARAEEASLLRVLTKESLDADLARGAVRTGGPRDGAGFAGAGRGQRGEPAQVRLTDAVAAALLAFDDGLFKVFVGDRELAGTAVLPVDDGASLLFLRLVPVEPDIRVPSSHGADRAQVALSRSTTAGLLGQQAGDRPVAELLAVVQAGGAFKSVPAALRKDPDVAALRADLAKQAASVGASLEAAMVAQDAFTLADLADLRRHPVVAPMLAALVWVAEDGVTGLLGNAFGALPDEGTVLRNKGSGSPGRWRRAPAGPLRVAHPVHFVADGTWVAWQERLFRSGRRQPFKQVFRELYVPTEEEVKTGPLSHRYDGHQVQPRQALALLGGRGWVASRETGDAARAFHSYGLVARVMTSAGFLTAAEADLPAVNGVCFTRRGDYLAQPLDAVPRVAFSEAMRDLDLMVSVAHAGGVDPEATASTTEMRVALLHETARLLKLGNVGFAGQQAVIAGRLGEYSVHLGSGTVHRRPGGAVCIIPVGSQHRGRLFLPFADDDPKTAEIVAKVLLLARDHEIRDPAILGQLR